MRRYRKDNEIQHRRRHRLRDKIRHKLVQPARSEPPAAGVGDGVIPEGLDGDAGHPVDEGDDEAPEGDEGDEDFAEQGEAGGGLEDAEVLEEEGDFDKGYGEGEGEVANVHHLAICQMLVGFGVVVWSYLEEPLDFGGCHGVHGFPEAVAGCYYQGQRSGRGVPGGVYLPMQSVMEHTDVQTKARVMNKSSHPGARRTARRT